ncbi:uncharacterized protein PRCAT00002288001 [Priceomyces carsonii]|uniref:uncharacterized protein n=1 Tax=Priceomyces carsonii TaxID=28549 RepID=UPI002ED7F3FE|nr:unnamed protein product [Priceomyces carsonii]
MDNLYTALSLAMIARRRFVILTNSSDHLIEHFRRFVLQPCNFNVDDICELDLMKEFKGVSEGDFIRSMVVDNIFKKVIIWRNMLKLNRSEQRRLYEFLLKLDCYDTNSSVDKDFSVELDGRRYKKPDLFVIVPVITDNCTFMYEYLKERFWFSTYYRSESSEENKEIDSSDFVQRIGQLRKKFPDVYVAPDVERYIYSLIVHIRCHRLCSVAPKSARITTRAIQDVTLLSRVLVAFQNYGGNEKLFVTPLYAKLAMKKVGYWLVTWELSKFAGLNKDTDEEKRLEISMLTGDWIGSDWKYVKAYFKQSRSRPDPSTPTGLTNTIVEDAIATVEPPL